MVEVEVRTLERPVHSGIFGGSVENPAMALCRLLAQVHDRNGRITIPGFYDDVAPLSKFEREQFKKLPYNAEQYRKLHGGKDAPGSPKGEGSFSEWAYFHYGRWSLAARANCASCRTR